MQGNKHSETPSISHKINSIYKNDGIFRFYLLLPPLERRKKVSDCDKIFVRTLVPQYGVTIFTISVLSNKFSPLISLAFKRLPYTDDRNYRPHPQSIYL